MGIRTAWKPLAVGVWLFGSIGLLVIGGMTDSLFGGDPPSVVPQHSAPTGTSTTAETAVPSPVPVASAAPPAPRAKDPSTATAAPAAPEAPKPVAPAAPSASAAQAVPKPNVSPSPPLASSPAPKETAPTLASPPPVAKAAAPVDAPLALPADDAMSAEQRRQVQMALQRHGYEPGPVDGVFGPLTRAAIRRFQQAVGSTSTGVLTADEASRLVTAAGG